MKKNISLVILFALLVFNPLSCVQTAMVIDHTDRGHSVITYEDNGEQMTIQSPETRIHIYHEEDFKPGPASGAGGCASPQVKRLSVEKRISLQGVGPGLTYAYFPHKDIGKEYGGYIVLTIRNSGTVPVGKFSFVETSVDTLTVEGRIIGLDPASYTVKKLPPKKDVQGFNFLITHDLKPGQALTIKLPVKYVVPALPREKM